MSNTIGTSQYQKWANDTASVAAADLTCNQALWHDLINYIGSDQSGNWLADGVVLHVTHDDTAKHVPTHR